MIAGLTGFLAKASAYEELLNAVDVVLAGGIDFAARMEASGGTRPTRPPFVPAPAVTLSPTELAIARLVVA